MSTPGPDSPTTAERGHGPAVDGQGKPCQHRFVVIDRATLDTWACARPYCGRRFVPAPERRQDCLSWDSRSSHRRVWRPFTTKHFGTPQDPYLDRTVIVSTPWFGVYLHHIWREDRDDFPHDHPWPFVTMILRGGYQEEWFPRPHSATGWLRRWERWSLHRVPLSAAHRIASVDSGTVSLILRGRRRADDSWSFWVPVGLTRDQAKPVPYDEYLGLRTADARMVVAPEATPGRITDHVDSATAKDQP